MSWTLRPIVWFATASMAITTCHELVHAIVAQSLGVRATLRNYSASIHLTPEQAATNIPAIIRVAGPSSCLILGLIAWMAYKQLRRDATRTAAELPLLFIGVFGIATFFGNLMSASFIGDFSTAAEALHLPMAARYALSLLGAVGVVMMHVIGGRELMRWPAASAGTLAGILGVVAAPGLIGRGVVILANLPAVSLQVQVAEGAFWIFAVVGALSGAAGAGRGFHGADRLRGVDVVALLGAVVVVQILVRGVPFEP